MLRAIRHSSGGHGHRALSLQTLMKCRRLGAASSFLAQAGAGVRRTALPAMTSEPMGVRRMSSWENTQLNGTNALYVEEMFQQWRQNPASVHKSWDVFFRTGSYASPPTLVGDYVARAGDAGAAAAGAHGPDECGPLAKEGVTLNNKVVQMVRAFQVRGHLIADIDPLALMRPRPDAETVSLANFGLSEGDREKVVDLTLLDSAVQGFLGKERGKVTVGEIYDRLVQTYCGHIGYEYMHIPSTEQCNFLRSKIETPKKWEFSKEKKLQILDRLMWADHFERFLAKKWPAAKRFGLEGGESTIPGIKAVMDTSALHGVDSIIIGMAHRGRLNMLSNVIRKPIEQIFTEFEGGGPPNSYEGSGDVKYHLGMSLDRPAGPNGTMMHLSLLPNPSHLECVDPVVCGKARARQFYKGDTDRSKVLPMLLHGDAAFAGQGVVYETLGLSKLPSYTTGGVIHVVTNNQVGFTTDPAVGRSSPYSTDIAKAFNAPIFHVNGNDPEACVHVCELAAEWRAKFKTDVVIDMVCYRKHGHNEADEPMFTQPQMYSKIKAMPSVLDVYKKQLLDSGVATAEEVDAMSNRINSILEEKFKLAQDRKKYTPQDWNGIYKQRVKEFGLDPSKVEDPLNTRWSGMKSRKNYAAAKITGIPVETLLNIGTKVYGPLPADFHPHNNLRNIRERTVKRLQEQKVVDWAGGEALAFGSLLLEGHHVRLSGQDVERGTFSHRHALLVDQKAPERKTYVPLNHLSDKQAAFSVSNSHLSEFGVLGFEFGYSLENPNSLVCWEAQFGDFTNGAQVILDQFLSSGEDKWGKQSGLTLLLPHGMEGQGPEHSSARLERFLEAMNDDPDVIPENEYKEESLQIQQANWQVCNLTTPANYFHALRRQVKRDFRKPLIIMSPKSLLRHPLAISTLEEMGDNTRFSKVYPEHGQLVAADKVKRLVYCTGKVYYDLLQLRTWNNINDVALVRVEQIAPFPFHLVAQEARRFKNAEIFWCQEEHQNQGAWHYVFHRFHTALGAAPPGFAPARSQSTYPKYVGRPSAAAPATGLGSIHQLEFKKFAQDAFGRELQHWTEPKTQ